MAQPSLGVAWRGVAWRVMSAKWKPTEESCRAIFDQSYLISFHFAHVVVNVLFAKNDTKDKTKFSSFFFYKDFTHTRARTDGRKRHCQQRISGAAK